MSFLKGVFSDGDSPSSSRVIMGLFAVNAVGWVWYVVLKAHAIPSLADLALFVSSPYLVNQARAAIETIKK